MSSKRARFAAPAEPPAAPGFPEQNYDGAAPPLAAVAAGAPGRDGVPQPFTVACIDDNDIRITAKLAGLNPATADAISITVTVDSRYGPPGAPPLVQVPVTIIDDDALRALHAMTAHALTNQAEADGQRFTPAPVASVAVAPPQSEGLIVFVAGNRKVADERSGRTDNCLYVSRGQVHRAECARLNPAGGGIYVGQSFHARPQTADWPALAARVRAGELVPECCGTCKPLGPYGNTLTARLAWPTFTKPPTADDGYAFSAQPYGYVDSPATRRHMWVQLTRMTPQRWADLADWIETTAEQLDQEEA